MTHKVVQYVLISTFGIHENAFIITEKNAVILQLLGGGFAPSDLPGGALPCAPPLHGLLGPPLK